MSLISPSTDDVAVAVTAAGWREYERMGDEWATIVLLRVEGGGENRGEGATRK
jgi:hypothetical protein